MWPEKLIYVLRQEIRTLKQNSTSNQLTPKGAVSCSGLRKQVYREKIRYVVRRPVRRYTKVIVATWSISRNNEPKAIMFCLGRRLVGFDPAGRIQL